MLAFRHSVSPEEAAHTLHGLVRYRSLTATKRGREVTIDVDVSKARRIINKVKKEKREWLNSEEVAKLLTLYGIPLVETRFAKDPVSAAGAAHKIRYPVVLKADAPTLIHKSDVAAVRVGLSSADEVLAAAHDMEDRLRGDHPGLRFIVQAMATGHRELLLGMSRDSVYGPQIVVGFGGTEVEVWKNVALRSAPLYSNDPQEMMASLRGAEILDGYRNQPAIDKKLMTKTILQLSQMSMDLEDIMEMDLNPFIVGKSRKDSAVVDARIMIRL